MWRRYLLQGQGRCFFTGREYVEIGPKFKGKLTLPLMGGKRGSFFKVLGNPKLKDTDWDAFDDTVWLPDPLL